jgi:Late embryogenesis abundant protein
MTRVTLRRHWLLAATATPLAWLAACATPTPKQPLAVNVISVQRMPEAAPELRFNARLRLINQNSAAVSFHGASARLILLSGEVIGHGVVATPGHVPALGEAVLELPISITNVGALRRALGLYAAPDRRLEVTLRGQLDGPMASDVTFEWRSELALPLAP